VVEINVIVVDRGRKNLYLRYTDPVTGQKVEKSSGTPKKKEAVKKAGEWQTELANGIVGKSTRLRWNAFREAYEDHVAATLSKRTTDTVFSSFNVIQDTMKPAHVRQITTEWITKFQKRLIDKGRRAATAESHCRIDEQSGKTIHASAHDLRRAFGQRWSRKVSSMILKELMRHDSVTTTEKYYVDINAQETARFLRKVTLEVTPKKKADPAEAETA